MPANDRDAIKELISRATKNGIITYDELSAALSHDEMTSEQIEDIMTMISEMATDTVVDGTCEVPETATIERLPPSQYERVESIVVEGFFTGIAPPTSLQSIGTLSLCKCEGMPLPEGIVQIDAIDLEYSHLALPSSVQRVGRLEINYSDSSLDHANVKEFGDVLLLNADFTFAEGVRKIGNLDASTSSVQLPSTLESIGNISLRHDYDAEDVIEWPEGTLSAGEIRMSGPTRIRVPASVTKVSAVHLREGAQLSMGDSTNIEGECHVAEGAQLIRY